MKKLVFSILLVSLFAIVIGQDSTEKRQIVPKGDAKKGSEAFLEKNCYRCHVIEGEKFPEADVPPIHSIELGGEKTQGWTRDLFAEQIMNPQHVISPQHQAAMAIVGDRLGAEVSPMPNFNELLSLSDLINLSTFLEEKSQ